MMANSTGDADPLASSSGGRAGSAPTWPRWNPNQGGLTPVGMLLAAFVVGIGSGFGAVFFRTMISAIHNLAFLGKVSILYDASEFVTASPWGALIILVPVIGSFGVTFIIEKLAHEARGHGVPEVMDAIYYNNGVIRPVVGVAKALASALAIGTGASVGREGPFVQIGSAFGSTLGQILPVRRGQRITLVAAGAGAGIAATFNTPIGGVLFAIELLLPEVSINTFLPVALATATATFIDWLFFGPQPAFFVPSVVPMPNTLGAGALILGLYVLLGCLSGVVAVAFIRGLDLVEDVFDRIPQPYVRHAAGMLLVGLIFYSLHWHFGHYFLEGVGYSTIQEILKDRMAGIGLAALLCIGKIVVSSLSLGSGSSGGIFSPSLYMGATLGSAVAGILAFLLPSLPISLPAFAIVGMGAVVGGTTGAAMTAVTMIFEMTRDYAIVLPMILAVAASLGVRRLLSPDSIYTAKLSRRGKVVPTALHTNMFLVRRAREVMEPDFLLVQAETGLDAFLRDPAHRGAMRHLLVTRGDHIAGVARINTGLRHGLAQVETGITLGDVASRNFVIVREDDVAFDVIVHLFRHNARMAVVVRRVRHRFHLPRARDVVGVITKEHVADAVASSIEVYPR